MSFQPVIPFSGYSGWTFLKRTMDEQQDAYSTSSLMQREVAYFQDNIGAVTSAADLVGDRTLLKVALGAFGLGDDLNNKAFIQKILDEGTLSDDAFANKLADKRYKEFSAAFGFGDYDTPNTKLSDFAGDIVSAYQTRQFEVAVGDQDENMRIALNLQRELEDIAARDLSEDAMWYTVMGNAALREAFETALGLPSGFSSLDLDDQLEIFKDKTSARFGESSIAQFASADKREEAVRLFLLRSEVSAVNISTLSSQAALTLLQGAV